MKKLLRQCLPAPIVTAWRALRDAAGRYAATLQSSERIFTAIYRHNQWGGSAGGICSGGGSADPLIMDRYLGMLRHHALLAAYHEAAFVDLGCGDMLIGQHLIPLCRSYLGVDIVKFLIVRHQAQLGSAAVRFMHLDIINNELPPGDVCFLRQVLQHLSNKQILKILPKLKQYKYVYITEHVPTVAAAGRPNLDKPHGKGIRLDRNSGVDLTAAPFGLPSNQVTVLLEVAGNAHGGDSDPGLIRTMLYSPGAASVYPDWLIPNQTMPT